MFSARPSSPILPPQLISMPRGAGAPGTPALLSGSCLVNFYRAGTLARRRFFLWNDGMHMQQIHIYLYVYTMQIWRRHMNFHPQQRACQSDRCCSACQSDRCCSVAHRSHFQLSASLFVDAAPQGKIQYLGKIGTTW